MSVPTREKAIRCIRAACLAYGVVRDCTYPACACRLLPQAVVAVVAEMNNIGEETLADLKREYAEAQP